MTISAMIKDENIHPSEKSIYHSIITKEKCSILEQFEEKDF
jgi:hypothetical protein